MCGAGGQSGITCTFRSSHLMQTNRCCAGTWTKGRHAKPIDPDHAGMSAALDAIDADARNPLRACRRSSAAGLRRYLRGMGDSSTPDIMPGTEPIEKF
jgi:hypothetical protein